VIKKTPGPCADSGVKSTNARKALGMDPRAPCGRLAVRRPLKLPLPQRRAVSYIPLARTRSSRSNGRPRDALQSRVLSIMRQVDAAGDGGHRLEADESRVWPGGGAGSQTTAAGYFGPNIASTVRPAASMEKCARPRESRSRSIKAVVKGCGP